MDIDFSHIADLASGEPAVLKSLLQMIAKQLVSYPSLIADALQADDYQQVSEQAHKFKSSVVYLHSDAFTLVLEQLESTWKNPVSKSEMGILVEQMISTARNTLDVVQGRIDTL